MSSFERDFSDRLISVERSVFVELVRSRPDMTIAELAGLTKGRFAELANIVTVGDVLGASAPAPGRGKGKRGRKRAAAPAAGGAINTRTPAGRAVYDEAVHEAVKAASAPISAPEVRASAGGTELQVRKSLNRLIEAGKITFKGKARGTRYMIA